MPLHLLLHTLSTSSPVAGSCVVYWQNPPRLLPGAVPKTTLVDATPLTLDQIWPRLRNHRTVTLVGIDVLLPLKVVSPQQVVSFVRALSEDDDDDDQDDTDNVVGGRDDRRRTVTVLLNADDALRSSPEHDLLLRSLAHAASRVTALRALPSGRDREFAGMARFTRGGHACRRRRDRDDAAFIEGERLYTYGEDMMTATLHS